MESKRGRGRPPGPTTEGLETRERLYGAALDLIRERGYEETTLRDIAARAGASPGLLYRYFPGKRAVVLELYDRLSSAFAARSGNLRPGPWRDRFMMALRLSLEVLAPQRGVLGALIPVLVGTGRDGLFAPGTELSRVRVQGVFADAVLGATDVPRDAAVAAGLGRLLYLAHLGALLGWLLDLSPGQRATRAALALLEKGLPLLSFALKLGTAKSWIRSADALFQDALWKPEGRA